MPRTASRLLALLLSASALAGCAAMGGASKDVAATKNTLPTPKAIAGDVDGNLRQAQLLRQAGSYDESIRILSQLMLVAADDPRVVSEYGKALAQKGRAQDATQFLRRAIELSPGDWTLYSALGVSYDQLSDQANARLAYEHALLLRPGEPSVLNNYALSRMLAKDPDGARALIARAQAAAGANADAKIARNVALINEMVPPKAAEADKPAAVAQKSAPAPASKPAAPEPKVAAASKPAPVTAAPAPQPVAAAAPAPADGKPRSAGDVARLLANQTPAIANAAPTDAATGAPRPLTPPQPAAQPAAPAPQATAVVMQAVPYDPYAGPVASLKKPKPKTVAKAEPKGDAAKDKAADAKPAPQKTASAKPDVVPALRVAADKY